MKLSELRNSTDERIRVLHYTWLAFFITFYIWFNMAPLSSMILKTVGWMTIDHIKVLAISNIALTIPARIWIGSIVDRYGPRIVFSIMLILIGIPCVLFAFGNTFLQLFIARLVLSTVGAGFIVGIRMITQWFPNNEMGFTSGIYAGWGNFGSAVAAMTLPWIAITVFGGSEDGWRYAIAFNGVVAMVYGAIYYFNVRDYPGVDNQCFFIKGPAKNNNAMIYSWGSLIQYILWTIPLFGGLGILVWRFKLIILHSNTIHKEQLGFIINGGYIIIIILWLLYIIILIKCHLPKLNGQLKQKLHGSWKTIGALNITYFANFGAELAIISMLPLFFESFFLISPIYSGLFASLFAWMNLVARPFGGWLSDQSKTRKQIVSFFMTGVAVSFILMSFIIKYEVNSTGIVTLVPAFDGTWWLIVSIMITVIASFFVQSAEGATFAIIPEVNKQSVGKISGLVGAYGNLGALVYLVIYSLFDEKIFFLCLASSAILSSIYCWFFIKEIKVESSHR